MSTDGEIRETAIGIFKLLREFAQIRRSPKLDIDEFENHLWLYLVPTGQYSYNRLFHDERDIDPDVWIEIQRRDEPSCPAPPAICRPWLRSRLSFDDQEPPTLLDRIPGDPQPIDETGDSDDSVEWKSIDDFPQVSERWERFLEDVWLPWAEKHEEWRKHYRLYSTLFSIRQTLRRAGEQFELVVGFGLLETETTEQRSVRRHVLTIQAALDFDLRDGRITVRAPLEGLRPTLEFDMLPVDQRPSDEVIEFFNRTAAPRIEDDPWAPESVTAPLMAFTNSYPDGVFRPHLEPSEDRDLAFRVTLAPALVLRRRSTRGMLATFTAVIDHLENGGKVPPSIGVISGSGSVLYPGDPSSTGVSTHPALGRVFFPKPTNAEQLEIVHRMESRNGLLVQGPPGTGKSHTIANLISHLLATGRRVLVTAETPRALAVLAAKIPDDIRPLCVSLLGSDRVSQAGLEASVKGIAEHLTNWDPVASAKETSRLNSGYESLLTEREKIDARLRLLREAETEPHVIARGAFRGSAQSIAEAVARSKEKFEWLSDEVDSLAEPPLSASEFTKLLELLRTFDDERLRELQLELPDPQRLLPPVQEILQVFERERTAADALSKFDVDPPARQFSALERAGDDAVHRLAVALDDLHQAVETAGNRPLPWVKRALQEVLAGDDTPWRSLREVTSTALEAVSEPAARADRRRVLLPDNADRIRCLADAVDALRVLESGTKLNLANRILNPHLRNARYLLKGASVDGRRCNSVESLGALVESLTVSKILDDAWRQWADHASSRPSTLTAQVARLTENVEALDQIFTVTGAVNRARECVREIGGLPEAAWHDGAECETLRRYCQFQEAVRDRKFVSKQLNEIVGKIAWFVSSTHAHPIAQRILVALRGRDIDAIIEARVELLDLLEARNRAQMRDTLLGRLKLGAPETAALLEKSSAEAVWDERAEKFELAWQWAQARSWVADVQGRVSSSELNDRHTRLTRDAERELEKLASAHAWNATLGRMTEQHRQHLVAWQQVMKKGGKFRGKHAATYRSQAQEHLEKCRDAIPAWVMPLFYMYETVRPQPEMFDVVIVDEASQCSLDALILMYIGKKIIIVGDDEQISPTAIGVKGDEFRLLVDHFLPGFEHASAFHAETSLFDLGNRWFPDRIVLREHFRCMPEIIRFSNDLCYRSTPLIPLRQYPPNRLEPVKTTFVMGGAQRGSSSEAINDVEARALADALVECCASPAYEGKEFGVISLLGEAQARKIESLLMGRLGPEEIEKRRIVCGDAYAFQGDERDVMFLSMVNAATDESGVRTRGIARIASRYKQRYNVAVSRAKDQVWLFHSMTLDDLPNPEDLRRALVEFCIQGGVPQSNADGLDVDEIRRLAFYRDRNDRSPAPFDSWFEVDVFLRINDAGYRVIPQFEFAGYFIDLVVEYGAKRLAVECDGDTWHGPERFLRDLDRQRQLRRAGWTFWRIRGSEFYACQEKALEGLWAELDRLGIKSKYRSAHAQSEPDTANQPPADTESEDEFAASPSSTSGSPTPDTPEDSGFGVGAPGDIFGEDASGEPEPFPTSGRSGERPPGSVEPPRTRAPSRTLSTYLAFQGRRLPDPHHGTDSAILAGLLEIVRVEGPILREVLIRRYTYSTSTGLKKAGKLITKKLGALIKTAERRGDVVVDYQHVTPRLQAPVIRLPDQQSDVSRELGPRDLHEVPPCEIATVMRQLMTSHDVSRIPERDPFFRLVLDQYGLKRLTAQAKEYLETVLSSYIEGSSR